MIIGLTGGIASGKSTAAKTLGDCGAYVIDADKLGHRAYVKDTAAFHAVVAAFGKETIGEDGEIDRRVLGGKVFGHADGLKKLTDIVWPAIRDMATVEMNAALQDQPERVVVLEAAVLIEAGWQDLVDEIWVVIVNREVAIERAVARDGVEAAAIEARIDAQLSNDQRTAQAQQIVDNSATPAELEAQLQTLWSQLGEHST